MKYYRENPEEAPNHDWTAQATKAQEPALTQAQVETVERLRRLQDDDVESGHVMAERPT